MSSTSVSKVRSVMGREGLKEGQEGGALLAGGAAAADGVEA